MRNEKTIKEDITGLLGVWRPRNTKFQEIYKTLALTDELETKGMETFVSNEPRTFYNLAHYLMTGGEVKYSIPITGETPDELLKQASCERACKFLMSEVDRARMIGGKPSFLSELGFSCLGLGWYAVVATIDLDTMTPTATLWSPVNIYPRFEDGILDTCNHHYQISQGAAKSKAKKLGWDYNPTTRDDTRAVTVDSYFYNEDGKLYNMVLIDDKPVTPVYEVEGLLLLVAPIGGFPDFGTILGEYNSPRWVELIGQSILSTNLPVYKAYNKWMSFQMQILRDSAQPKWQEISAAQHAKPEEINVRGAVFHYSPGDAGLSAVQPPVIPLELRSSLLDMGAEKQKGGFPDTLYGILQGGGMPGYTYSQIAEAANQVMSPYMTAKHFVLGELARFWLSQIKKNGRTLEIKGKTAEKLPSSYIPTDVHIEVTSEIATAKNWLERATVTNMLWGKLDNTTIMDEVLKIQDTEKVKDRKVDDMVFEHPMAQMLQLAVSFRRYAKFLNSVGDKEQAAIFLRAATALESQLGTAAQPQPPKQQPQPQEEVPGAAPQVAPPEATGGFTPEEYRGMGMTGAGQPPTE